LVLVDTSSSMGLTDVAGAGVSGSSSRAQEVAAVLRDSDLLPALGRTHEVVVFRFDETLRRIASFAKGEANRGEKIEGATASEATPEGIDWSEALTPSGSETRLGQSLEQLIHEERNSPVAGIVLLTDGGQNAGSTPEAAVDLARDAEIPVFTVGIGSLREPANVRVYKIEAVSKAFPGDPFTVTGLIQTQGRADELAGTSVTAELLQRDTAGQSGDAAPGTGAVVQTEQILLGAPGESVPVKFQMPPPTKIGKKTLCLRVRPLAGDSNPADDFAETVVDVVDRKDRVLLLAGGPTREYRFVRNLLHRDSSMTVDVLLQTAQAGMSQEAAEVLDDFPATREEMFSYDCVLAFDADWQALAPAQIDLLESWVAEQAGGMIVVAGPVYTGEVVGGWVQDESPAMEKIRAMIPVEFPQHVSVWEAATYVAKEPWPLEFEREGLEAEFLWLDETQTASQLAWAGFQGVYSHQPVRGVKMAATVYARFSDPRSGQGEKRPAFLAGQFYGSGQVFYIGSGEMWRLRGLDPGYFERFYTQLIRHVSQGRLFRQSSRGLLMVAQDRYVLGNSVKIRAQLTNAQLAPLDEPGVPLQVIRPDGGVNTIRLGPDPTRVGTYGGEITVLQEGGYRLELPIPGGGDQRITRSIQVSLPDLERQNPARNEALLNRIAEGTGARYFDDLREAVDGDGPDPLVKWLRDRTQTSILTAAPDRLWEETGMRWAMAILCGLLCLEWLLRRLFKLA
jgi:hypothetical protein